MKRERNRLRVLRAERRMTQFKTAQRAGLQPSRLSLIENGHVEPTEAERLKLARALGVEVTAAFPVPEDHLESVAS
jgi:transcriptional regulator with XRE-family HTH domain